MALDYSKLTDAELDAIANDDYSKLSDSTLQMLASEPNTGSSSGITQPEPSLGSVAESQALGVATKFLMGDPGVAPTVVSNVGPIKPTVPNTGIIPRAINEVGQLGKIAGQISPATVADFFEKPLSTLGKVPGAFIERYTGPNFNTSLGEAIKNIPKALPAAGRAIGSALLAPENIMLAPYQMAAYEQEKIRANPNAPEYAKNPYAMSFRSSTTPTPITQGQAGAMNRRNVIANMPYGNVTAEERAILDQDRMRREQQQIRAKQVLQQPPTAQNYIERMRALSTLYSPLNEQ